MRLPILQGVIKRRMLINFRADANVIRAILPAPFRPKMHENFAVAGICLIRLERMRPKLAPAFVGLSSENAAHRIAIEWDENGATREGVYVPRRDTGSLLNHAVGGTLFPGEHHKAVFAVEEWENKIDFKMKSDDDAIKIEVSGEIAATLPPDSIFRTLKEASDFFQAGSLGFSVTKNPKLLDGVELATKEWKVDALNADFVNSSFYENENVFPKNSIKFDHALIMRNIKHEWHNAPSFELK